VIREPSAGAQARCLLEPGTVIRETYSVVKFIGAGRFADVYLVRHRFMGMQAMKILVDGLDEADRLEGLREAFLLSRMSHPGLVRVFDANRIDSSLGHHPYITMEHVGLGNLASLIANAEAGLKIDVALEFAEQIAAGLAHAHAMEGDLVHRDLKPANILVDLAGPDRWILRISDFGLAVPVDRLLRVAEAGGTLMYMSPESLRGFETQASDVYSAGLVIFELLTGMLPYPKQEFAGVRERAEIERRLAAMHDAEYPAPSAFDNRITPDVDSVVARALDRDLEVRFRSGVELAEAIAACRHARASPMSTLVWREFAEPLREIFALAGRSEGLQQAADRLVEMGRTHPVISRVFAMHVRQMRSQLASRADGEG
jgi:serine/threonine protein kinase